MELIYALNGTHKQSSRAASAEVHLIPAMVRFHAPARGYLLSLAII